jgi:hypothetical protein
MAPDETPMIRKSIIEVLNEMDTKQAERFARMEKQTDKKFEELKCEIRKVNEQMEKSTIQQTKFGSGLEYAQQEIIDLKAENKEQENKIIANMLITKAVAWIGGIMVTATLGWLIYLILNGSI